MNKKIRKFLMLLLMTTVVFLLVGCAFQHTETETTESTKEETPKKGETEEDSEDEDLEDEDTEDDETEDEETEEPAELPEGLAIQSLQGLSLKKAETEFPYLIKLQDSGVKAVKYATEMYQTEESTMAFSFIPKKKKKEELTSIAEGRIVETNEEIDGNYSVTEMGGVYLFSLELEEMEKPSTLVYEVNIWNNKINERVKKYIAFRIIPE